MARPEAAPARRPMSRPMMRVSQPGRPTLENIHAETMADSAATEPTDRSMPEVTMTKVMPKAMMATTAA